MKIVVVGAGAWGLPAAAELQRRGHQVLLIDAYGAGTRLSSSTGPTRIWRLTHPDAVRVRLGVQASEALDRVAERSGRQVHTRLGLLWRDTTSLGLIDSALTANDVPFTRVGANDVGQYFPGLRPDGRDAIWQHDAGTVLADIYLQTQLDLFAASGGRYRTGILVTEITDGPSGLVVRGHGLKDGTGKNAGTGGAAFTEPADTVVLAAGAGMREWLPALGYPLALRVILEQVIHIGTPAQFGHIDSLPCLIDGPSGRGPGVYAMPTPGRGFKLGLDSGRRDLTPGEVDRTPNPEITEQTRARAARMLDGITAEVLDVQACPWTLSPDNRFIIDTLPNGIVVAGGDCGEGFKFTALMGEILADRAEGRRVDDDVASFSLARFAGGGGQQPLHDHGFGV